MSNYPDDYQMGVDTLQENAEKFEDEYYTWAKAREHQLKQEAEDWNEMFFSLVERGYNG